MQIMLSGCINNSKYKVVLDITILNNIGFET